MSVAPSGDLARDLAVAEQLIASGRMAEAQLLLRAVIAYAPGSRDAAMLLAKTAVPAKSRLLSHLPFWKAVLLIVAVIFLFPGVENTIRCFVDYAATGKGGMMLHHSKPLLGKYTTVVEWVSFWEALGWALLYLSIAVLCILVVAYPWPWRRWR